MPTPTAKPPGNTAHLQRLAKDGAEQAGVPQGRYQRWLNTVLLSAVLSGSRDEVGDPLFALKGGAAMELRLGVTARASKDYDAAFRDRSETMLDRLDEALADGWMDFAFQRTEAVPIRHTSALRMDVKLSYKGRPWGTVQLEIAPAEGEVGQEIDRVPAQPLDPVQLAGPGYIACVSVRYQIAQKIHACTEVYEDGSPNDRFRDLVDLQLLRELIRDDELSAVRRGCVEIFDLRATHAWPPEVRVWPDWGDGFRAMAADVAFFTDDVEAAAEGLRELIAEIDAAR